MMKLARLAVAMAAVSYSAIVQAQPQPQPALSPQWEDLTSADFAKALKQADGVCVLPMGSIEKNGPAEPMGTNLFVIRAVVTEAVRQSYAVIFPPYFVAQTNDVSNLAGAIAYSGRLQRDMLEETVSERGRNGCAKILIVNGHSGNNGLLQEFLGTDMSRPKDYVVYAIQGGPPKASPNIPEFAHLPPALMSSKPGADGHGGEERTSILMATNPDLVHPERGHDEPIIIEGSRHLNLPGGMQGVQTGVARAVEAPGGYLGDASGATAGRGKALLDYTADRIVAALRAVKADDQSAVVQRRFFEQREHP
ncbi:MAG: creatininase family protein [Caulobacteraceae bacterium]